MNEENIVRYSRDNLPKDTKTDWARVAAMTEEEIEANALSDPDNLPIDFTDPDIWQRSATFFYPRGLVRLNLDPDILAWFQGQGSGFRQQIGSILQTYMETNEHTEPSSRDKFEKEAP